MILFPIKLPWLPTGEDRAKWRKEDKERANRQFPKEIAKMMEESELSAKYLSQLEVTLSHEQMELYLKAKVHAQNSVFHKGRADILQKDL